MAQYQCSVIFQLILMYTNYFLEMTYLCGYQKADNHQSKRSKLFHLNFLCKLWKQFMLPPFLMVLFFQTSDFPKVKSTSPAREDWGIWHTFHSRPERCFVVESHDFVHISGWERILLTFSWVFFCMLRPCQAFFKSHNSQVNKRDLPKYCSTTLPRDYFRFQLKDVPQGWTPRPAVNPPRGEGWGVPCTVGKGGFPPRPALKN